MTYQRARTPLNFGNFSSHASVDSVAEPDPICPDCEGEGTDKFHFDCRRCAGEGIVDE